MFYKKNGDSVNNETRSCGNSYSVENLEFGLGFGVDVGVEEVHVWLHELFVWLDLAIEGESEWQGIQVSSSASYSAWENLVVSSELSDTWCVVWGNHEEELHAKASEFTAGQHQSGWESAMSLSHVQWELFFSVDGGHQMLVKIKVCGAILNEPGEVLRVASDDIIASDQVNDEMLQLIEVFTVFLNVINVAILIVLWSNKHYDNSLLSLGRLHVQVEFERNVVQAWNMYLKYGFVYIDIFDLSINNVGDISLEKF